MPGSRAVTKRAWTMPAIAVVIGALMIPLSGSPRAGAEYCCSGGGGGSDPVSVTLSTSSDVIAPANSNQSQAATSITASFTVSAESPPPGTPAPTGEVDLEGPLGQLCSAEMDGTDYTENFNCTVTYSQLCPDTAQFETEDAVCNPTTDDIDNGSDYWGDSSLFAFYQGDANYAGRLATTSTFRFPQSRVCRRSQKRVGVPTR